MPLRTHPLRGPRQYRLVCLQHENRAASVLPELRRRIVLHPALGSRILRRQRAMPRRGEPGEARVRPVRRPPLGTEHRRLQREARAAASREVERTKMATLGFLRRDFEVFAIENFNARMEKIYELVRPRLIRLGTELAPELSRTLNMEFLPHVATHMRLRAANAPGETWAAFGPSGWIQALRIS